MCQIINEQQLYFDKEINQYKVVKILKPPKHVKKEIAYLIKFLKKNRIKKVLDFGSGNGKLTIPLLKAKFVVHALDISENSLQNLNDTAYRLNLKKNLKTLNKFTNIYYQAIVGSDVLHHIKIDKHIKKFTNYLNKDGYVVFSEPNPLNPLTYVYYWKNHIPWQIEKRILQCNYFNLYQILKANDFIDIKFKGMGLLPYILVNSSHTLYKLNSWLGSLPILKLFAYRFIIIAKKK